MGPNEELKQKNWQVSDPTGDFLLMSNNVTHNGLRVTGCGVAAIDVDGDALAASLSALPQLGSPKQRVDPVPGGGVTVWWDVKSSTGSSAPQPQVMLAFKIPGQPGAIINFIDKRPAAP